MTLIDVDEGTLDDLGPGNGFMVAKGHHWVPALFANREAAELAFVTSWDKLLYLRKVVNHDQGRHITVEDFKKELA